MFSFVPRWPEQYGSAKKVLIQDSELERAKGYYTGQLIINNDTTDNITSFIGYQAIYNPEKILSIEGKQKIINQITLKDIIAVTNKYLNKNKGFLSTIGSISEKDIKI